MPELTWIGKSAVVNHHNEIPYRLLHSDDELSVGDPGTGNLLVEGDNLHALKALLPYYAGKVKCIYIDPPYNTGNEGWVYNDNVNSPEIRKWLGEVVGREAEDLTRHDKWLCMIYPRLVLLWSLLHDNGVIFISIDEKEAAHLKCVLDMIFGSSNLVAWIANVNNPKGRSDDKYVAAAHEYLFIYKKKQIEFNGWKPEHKVLRRYNRTDKNGDRYREIDLRKTGDNDRREDRENLFYYFMYHPKTKSFYPTRTAEDKPEYIRITPLREDGSEGNWRWGLETAAQNLNSLVPKLMPVRKVWTVFEKDYLKPDERVKPTTAWTNREFNSERGTEQFVALGFEKKAFAKPKPVGLITRILELISDKDCLVLDSFAGSGTTGHAIMQLNKEDGGNRRFILVEMEPQISREITAERLRRVIQGYGENEGLGGGFRYCKLGDPLFDEQGHIRSGVRFADLARHVFFTETGEPQADGFDYGSPLIGVHNGAAYYLLFNGILGDKSVSGGNVLTGALLKTLPPHDGPRVVFGEGCRLGRDRLKRAGVTFKQIPYEVKTN
ncbi:MAG: site-specific DNA-methyltransferase [Armatimonadetes bacterium]|nr:site-specific DNA-methyltransferase [Armatimonadota bacterium]